MFVKKDCSRGVAMAIAVACCVSAFAQTARQYTTEDYAAAEKFMGYNVNPLAYKGLVHAQTLDDGRFWYRAVDDDGVTFMVIDPAKGTSSRAFDQGKLAAALSAASSGEIRNDGRHLRFQIDSLSKDGSSLELTSAGISYSCQLASASDSCKRVTPASKSEAEKQPPLALSPDKERGAFIRDWNLWVRDMATGAETQLTTDGVKDYGYATDNAGWKQSDAAVLLWSPDSKKIATFSRTSARMARCILSR